MGGEQRWGGEWEGENALLYFNAVRGEVEQLSVTPASPPVTHTYIHAYIYTYIHTYIHTPPPRLGSHAERLRGRGNAAGGGAPRRARPRANIGQQRHLAAAPRRSAAGLWGGGTGGRNGWVRRPPRVTALRFIPTTPSQPGGTAQTALQCAAAANSPIETP